MTELSATDRRLLLALIKDARAPVTTLALDLGVSRATIQTSLNKLTRSGVIQRFTVEIDSGVGVDLVRAVSLVEVQGALTSTVVKSLRKLPGVASLHSTNGAWDLVVHFETPSLTEFDRLLRAMREIPGILNSETSILLAPAQ